MRDLNHFYRSERCDVRARIHDPHGFEWVDCNDADDSVISLLRKGRTTSRVTLVVMQLHARAATTTIESACRWGGIWREALNSDAKDYGGSGLGNAGPRRGRAGAASTAARSRSPSRFPRLGALLHRGLSTRVH